MNKKYTLDTISTALPRVEPSTIVFMYGDLGAWKTTLSRQIIQKYLRKNQDVTSPTYVYYNRYDDVYHFDLYRMSEYDEFVSIWWEEILDNNIGIIIIEWPQILEKYYVPDIKITLTKSEIKENERKIDIEYTKT